MQTTPRSRGKAVPSLDLWAARAGDWACATADDASTSGSGSGSGSGSDSAYGTHDERDPVLLPLMRQHNTSAGGRGRLRSTRSRSASVGWAPGREGLFALDLDYAHDSSSSEDLSASSSPSTLSVASSRRSSPEPSECDFFSEYRDANPRSSEASHPALAFVPSSPVFLSRRHTVPRRKRVRASSISLAVAVVSPPASLASTPPTPSDDYLTGLEAFPSLPPITFAATVLTTVLSLASRVGPIPLLPTSPVHLLRSRGHLATECINATLSPFLVTSTTSALSLGVANLAGLWSLEEAGSSGPEMAGLWGAIVAVRVMLAWVFGRVLGWAHPELFSTPAIHQVGAGLAPLLLALHLVSAYRRPKPDTSPLSFQVALLAANFSTPVEHGGTGLWWGLSAIVVGLGACLLLFVYETTSSLFAPTPTPKRQHSTSSTPATALPRLIPFLSLLVLPLLASYPTSSPASQISTSFAALHPEQPHLLTILLMTAPRPGDPDFLIQTIESWLGALPSPSNSSDLSPRLRLIVYTHFRTHDLFDAAERHFTSSPTYAAKTAQYVDWHRDPRGSNRLDQRLHVARGLDYASHAGGESAYVLLAEDDFPLCPNARGGAAQGWSETWDELKRAIVDTNNLMPDFPTTSPARPSSSSLSAYAAQEASSGHCGLFLATGGSGLALRGFVAARLPALLLGASDADGSARDARASAVRKEDEGADTPDLVIQDCLRGRIKGCEVCAPNPARAWPAGSRRNGGGALGDRWGKSGLAGTERLMQRHLGYNASTLPGRRYGKEEWACGWRQPFNGEPDVLTV